VNGIIPSNPVFEGPFALKSWVFGDLGEKILSVDNFWVTFQGFHEKK
jgi:hypothetical protein